MSRGTKTSLYSILNLGVDVLDIIKLKPYVMKLLL